MGRGEGGGRCFETVLARAGRVGGLERLYISFLYWPGFAA